jgi:sigma-E factor negative regulatory protein RseC
MICESGRVVAIEDNWLWVETHQASSCQSCAAKSGCGQGLINRVFAGKRHYVKVAIDANNSEIGLNDRVEIAIPENVILRSSFLMYFMPLVLTITGAVIGEYFAVDNGDKASILGAIAGFAMAAMLIRRHSYKNGSNPAYQPVLHRWVRPADASSVQTVVIRD